ncbi:hypothetical protein CB1_004955005 [Camelus ferus]|nr:hypothetical protein CB1_004955005 [Camelus ferus]
MSIYPGIHLLCYNGQLQREEPVTEEQEETRAENVHAQTESRGHCCCTGVTTEERQRYGLVLSSLKTGLEVWIQILICKCANRIPPALLQNIWLVDEMDENYPKPFLLHLIFGAALLIP